MKDRAFTRAEKEGRSVTKMISIVMEKYYNSQDSIDKPRINF